MRMNEKRSADEPLRGKQIEKGEEGRGEKERN
jgi:hypothetical protein